MASHKWSPTMGNDRAPQEEGEEGGRHDDGFDQEQDPELLDSHTCQDGLEDPVDEEGQETRRSDTSVRRKVVWKVCEMLDWATSISISCWDIAARRDWTHLQSLARLP